jgi:hypothetical protein
MALLKILSDNYLKQAQNNAIVPPVGKNGLGGSGTHDLSNCIKGKKKKKKRSSALKQIVYYY